MLLSTQIEVLLLLLFSHGLCIILKIQRIDLENENQNYNKAL